MNTPLTWLKASDGTPAVDMQVALVTPWQSVGVKDRPSFHNIWPAGPIGTFGVQFTNVGGPVTATNSPPYNASACDYPSAALGTQPTQPTGAADNAIISVDAIGQFSRSTYTPTPGQTAAGAGKLPATWYAFAIGDED
jgi:hypothetical protein